MHTSAISKKVFGLILGGLFVATHLPNYSSMSYWNQRFVSHRRYSTLVNMRNDRVCKAEHD